MNHSIASVIVLLPAALSPNTERLRCAFVKSNGIAKRAPLNPAMAILRILIIGRDYHSKRYLLRGSAHVPRLAAGALVSAFHSCASRELKPRFGHRSNPPLLANR